MKILSAQVHPALVSAFEQHQAEHPAFALEGASRFLCTVMERQLVHEAVNTELRLVNANHLYESPYWTSRGIVLIASAQLVLAVDNVPTAPAKSLSSIAQDAVVATLDDGVAFDCFAMPQDIRLDVLDPAKRVAANGSGMLTPGQVLEIDGAREVYDFYATRPDCLVIKAMSPLMRKFTWSFDRATLNAWNISSADQVDDQVITALDALAHLGDARVAATVQGFLGAASHHVRWKALQVLNELAPEVAQAAFEPFLNDPHPHIRAAAHKAMN